MYIHVHNYVHVYLYCNIDICLFICLYIHSIIPLAFSLVVSVPLSCSFHLHDDLLVIVVNTVPTKVYYNT